MRRQQVDLTDITQQLRERIETTVWCTLATVDGSGRPRTRIVHPVWEISDDDVVGWVGSRPTPKVRHIEADPAVSLMYWDPRHQQVAIDASATVHRDAATCRALWERFSSHPEPYGYDPAPMWPDGPESDGFVAIRLVSDRIELFGAPPLVWRRDLAGVAGRG